MDTDDIFGTHRITGVTGHPNGPWVTMDLADDGVVTRLLVRDRDTKYVAGFDQIFGPREPRSSRLRSERRMRTPTPNGLCARFALNASTTLGIANGCSANMSSITTTTDRTRASASRSLLSGQGTLWTPWRQRPRVTMTIGIPRLALSVVIVLAV
jgi:hypothetical protein